jgi:uncharacterized sodium:solute symporter family permease YidK
LRYLILEIFHVKLLDKRLKALARKWFSKAVRNYIGSRYLVNVDISLLHLLAEPMLMDVNVAETGVEFETIAREQADSL